MKRRSVFWLLVAWCCLPVLAAADPDIPGVLAKADLTRFANSPVVLVFDRTEVEVRDTGLSEMHFHQLYKVQKLEGATRLMTQVFEYDPKSSQVEVLRICLWRDGKGQELDLSTIRDVPAPAQAIYWEPRAKVFQMPRLKAGDAVEIETRRKGFILALLEESSGDEERFIPPMRGHFYDMVAFHSREPILEKTYQVRISQAKPLQYQFFHGEVEVETRLEGGKVKYRWTKKNIEPFKPEPNMVAADDVAPKLIVTTTATWNEKSAWFYKVNEEFPAFEVTPEIQQKVDELLKGVADEETRISILTHWVAENIRYSGLSMGQGEGYILHPGAMTFRDRSGVCKDKAGMRVTMLRAAGYESYPAMTLAGARIEDIPADNFNHSVTIVKRGDGRYQLLDPTWVPGTRELWSSLEQEQQYLMGVPETAGLMTTEWSPPEKHFIDVHSELRLEADGDLTGRLRIEADGQGDAAIRRVMLRNPRSHWAVFFNTLLAGLHPAAESTGLEFQDPGDMSRPMAIRLDFRCPGYAQVKDKVMMFKSPVLKQYLSDQATAFFLHLKVDAKERKYPLNGRCTGIFRWDEVIQLPAGYSLREVPAPIAVDGPAAAYRRTVQSEAGRVSVQAELVVKRRVFPAAEYGNLKEALDKLRGERDRWLLAEGKEVSQ